MAKPGFYGVRVGRKPGVYTTWDDTRAQTDGFTGAKQQKFPTRAQAEAFAFPGAATASTTANQQSTNVNRNAEDAPPAKKRKIEQYAANSADRSRTVYCDGSSLGNGKAGSRAGFGVYWCDQSNAHLNLSERLPGPLQTNNRAEMYAVARILETDPAPHLPLTICSDSQYTISVFKEWIPGWRAKGWKTSSGSPVLNKDLILYTLALLARRSSSAKITFQKVKAHCGIAENEEADQLAKAGAELPAVKDRDYAQDTRKLEHSAGVTVSGKEVEKELLEFEIQEGDLWTQEEMDEFERTGEIS